MVQVGSHFHKNEHVSRLCCNFKLWVELRVDEQHEHGFSVGTLCQWDHLASGAMLPSSCWKPNVTGCGRSNQCCGHCHCLKPQDCASCSNEVWLLAKHLLPVNHPWSSSFLFGNTRLHGRSVQLASPWLQPWWIEYNQPQPVQKFGQNSFPATNGRSCPWRSMGKMLSCGTEQLLSFLLLLLAKGWEREVGTAHGKGHLQLLATIFTCSLGFPVQAEQV